MKEGRAVEIYYFRSSRIPDGALTDDEVTPYVFVDGSLVSVGWAALGGPRTYGDTQAREKRLRAILGIMGQMQSLTPKPTQTIPSVDLKCVTQCTSKGHVYGYCAARCKY